MRVTSKHRAVSAYSFASTPWLGNSPYTAAAHPRSVNEKHVQAINDYYVSHVNWLIHRGRDDQIDAVADEYERDLRTLRARRQEPDQAA